jgi:hypothetical protein
MPYARDIRIHKDRLPIVIYREGIVMQAKEQLMHEIEQAPDSLVEEVLNYLLLKKQLAKTEHPPSPEIIIQNPLMGLFVDEPDQMEKVMQSIEIDRIRDREQSLE